MTPSNPAVVVPISRCLREPDIPSEPCGAALNRRKSDAHVPALHPELLLLISAVIHGQQDARPARAAARDPGLPESGMSAGRTPIFHELVERIVSARLRVRAAEQGI